MTASQTVTVTTSILQISSANELTYRKEKHALDRCCARSHQKIGIPEVHEMDIVKSHRLREG
jgi:hypothetical protein